MRCGDSQENFTINVGKIVLNLMIGEPQANRRNDHEHRAARNEHSKNRAADKAPLTPIA
jgi:hypothetical protein